MKEPDSFAAIWNEASQCFISEEFNAWSYTGLPGTWKPRIGNPKAQEAEMAKKTKKVEEALAAEVYPDQVLRPKHYTEGRKIEPWDAIADWGLDYFLGSATKYISRAGRKGDPATDIKKAIQFLQKKLELLGAKP